MPSDMRDELIERATQAAFEAAAGHQRVEAVLDSIPPGSFKLDEKTWIVLDERALARAMQHAWNDFCADTGCIPDDFSIHGNAKVSARFGEGNFTHHVLEWLKAEAVYTEVDHAE